MKMRSVAHGDKYYFAGKHQYNSTNNESYSGEPGFQEKLFFMNSEGAAKWIESDRELDDNGTLYSPLATSPLNSRPGSPSRSHLTSRPSSLLPTRPNSAMTAYSNMSVGSKHCHDYKAALAIVGKTKTTQLEQLIQAKVYSRVSSQSSGSYQQMWRAFDRNNEGKLSRQVFFDVCWQLGIRITKLEATALFGAYDTDLDGYISFYEFLHNVLKETETSQDCNACRRVQPI